MPNQEPGFDAVLKSLKEIVERLESGSLSLEQALGAFEEGVKLARQGTQILDAAEQKVEILLRAPGEDASVTAKPFEDA